MKEPLTRLARRSVLTAGLVAATPGAANAITVRGASPQEGITGADLPFLALAGFDLKTPRAGTLRQVLRAWSDLHRDHRTGRSSAVGLGPSLFTRIPELRSHKPEALRPLPAFPGEAIEEQASHGDLCVQMYARTPAAAADGLRAFVNEGRPWARLRWRQFGYRDADGTPDPRNAFGFRDGTANPATASLDQHLWVQEGPSWMRDGTFLVMRRIRLLLDTWDRTPLAQQEAMIGRTRAANARLRTDNGSHAGLAAPHANGGSTMLRRSYSYDAGVDVNGLQDSGLVFLAFQRDPHRQFVPVQQRLAEQDPLNAFSQHTATGVYACPRPPAQGSWIGEGLLP